MTKLTTDEALRTYTHTKEYGFVADDGWTAQLDPPRNEVERKLVSLPLCQKCGDPVFNLDLYYRIDVGMCTGH